MLDLVPVLAQEEALSQEPTSLSLHPSSELHGGGPSWRACRDFPRAEWPDGAVVYDPASGDTHHLTPAAACILALVRSGPRAQQDLAQCVLSSDLTQVDDTGLATLDATLSHLQQLGLIEPIPH